MYCELAHRGPGFGPILPPCRTIASLARVLLYGCCERCAMAALLVLLWLCAVWHVHGRAIYGDACRYRRLA